MENKNRLILVVVLVFILGFITELLRELIGGFSGLFIMGVGVWLFIESIVFIKKKENRDALPLSLIAGYLALSAVYYGFITLIAKSITSAFGVEGGLFQTIGFLWIFVSIFLAFVLGAWAIIKGIILIKNKTNVNLGIVSLIVGILLTFPSLIWIGGWFYFSSLGSRIS